MTQIITKQKNEIQQNTNNKQNKTQSDTTQRQSKHSDGMNIPRTQQINKHKNKDKTRKQNRINNTKTHN